MANIENFFNDAQYKEIIEQSETYNTRLCIERRLRMPFLDPQTGTAQNHSSLHKIVSFPPSNFVFLLMFSLIPEPATDAWSAGGSDLHVRLGEMAEITETVLITTSLPPSHSPRGNFFLFAS